MLVDIKNLIDLRVTASKENIGKVYDFYISDLDWNTSYAEIKPRLLVLKNILANNMNLGQPNFDRNLLPIMVTKDSAFELPESDSIKTHSEKVKHWSALNQWPINLANLNALNITDADKLADIMVRDTSEQGKNSHLRSFREIKGYQIKTPTGSFGHLKSLIMETDIWKIKYLLVQKRELFKSNKNILISPANVIDIKWESNVIFIDLSREIIEESPDYQNIKTISDTFERKLVKHQLKRSRQNKKIKQ